MKLRINLKSLVVLAILMLLASNVYLYTKTIVLGDDIVSMEKKIKELRTDNSEYEKNLSAYNSLTTLKKVAAQIELTQNASPLLLENLNLAAKRQDHE